MLLVFGNIMSETCLFMRAYIYDVREIFEFFTPFPPCHCHKSADFVPFVGFWGPPPHPLRMSYMKAPYADEQIYLQKVAQN